MRPSLNEITAPLLAWFDKNKRDLPWRRDALPYHVWVSEIMLQQTRIEAVIRYYERFMRELPDTESLSRVDDDRLLKLWEGLGYYSRARNLKKAAQAVMRDFGGVFPDNYADILTLPGIGEYTAGAIASICFNEKVPAVDGNVLRVVSRVLGSRKNVLLPETKKEVAALLREVMPERAGAFNEALMELGETLCLPNGEPACRSCPIRKSCAAYKNNLTAEIPVRIKQIKRRKEQKTVLLITAPNGKTALEKRGEGGLLSGMYQLPNVDGHLSEDSIRAWLRKRGLHAESVAFLKNAKHVFTHIDWLMQGWRVAVTEAGGNFIWASPDELRDTYALPAAFQRFITE